MGPLFPLLTVILCVLSINNAPVNLCPLDKDNDANFFWSEVESIWAAAKGVSTVKRPTKEKGKNGIQG